jgi:single-strand DNA-binding protein
MYNYVSVMGRLTHDPKLSKTTEGDSVITCRLAVDRNYSKKSEERKTDFFNIVAWHGNAESIANHLIKNSLVLVEGELRNKEYTDKNDKERTVSEINVRKVHFVGGSRRKGGK